MKYNNPELKDWLQVGWRSPSNIALIKYWGKEEGQVPMNPSLSFTLANATTETTLIYKKKSTGGESVDFDYSFEGKLNPLFSERVGRYLISLLDEFPFLQDYQIRIKSSNSYPHSAGIASSASSMSALALCLCSMEQGVTGNLNDAGFFQKASHIARLGSGSACRSIYGGFNAWGRVTGFEGSSDEFAVPLKGKVSKIFRTLQDSILIIDAGEKKVSSSQGHKLMKTHPLRGKRKNQAVTNFRKLMKVLETGNFAEFTTVVEEEAIALHALMQTSSPPFTLLIPETSEVINGL